MTITNGAVRGFNTGVRLSEAADGSVSALDIQAAGSGIALRGDSLQDSLGLEITGNTAGCSCAT